MLASALEWGHLVLAPSPQEACLKAAIIGHKGLYGFDYFSGFAISKL